MDEVPTLDLSKYKASIFWIVLFIYYTKNSKINKANAHTINNIIIISIPFYKNGLLSVRQEKSSIHSLSIINVL